MTIETECGHCQRPLCLRVDSAMKFEVESEGAAPVIFVPMVNFARLNEPSIIDAF